MGRRLIPFDQLHFTWFPKRSTTKWAITNGMEYRPGDIVNGHVLGSDNIWHQVESTAAKSPSPATLKPGAGTSYGDRYRSRWKYTAGIIAAISMLTILQPNYTFVDMLVSVALNALIGGSLINLVVAAFPSRR